MQSSIRAVTIWQPWASLIIIGAKPYEFRYRSYLAYINHPQPGERIAIHAGVRPVKREGDGRRDSPRAQEGHDDTALLLLRSPDGSTRDAVAPRVDGRPHHPRLAERPRWSPLRKPRRALLLALQPDQG